MTKTICSLLLLIFACSTAQAKDLQLINPEIFGQPTSTAIPVVLNKTSDEVEPTNIMLDIKDGKYYAASVIYSKNVTFAEARASLNKLYKSYENLSLFEESKMAVWRVKDKKFSINLTVTTFGYPEENVIRIMFIQFQPTKEVMKGILKSMGANVADKKCIESSETETAPIKATPN